MTFILALTLHPEYQVLGQAELDRVVGPNRLPTHDDRLELPYVDAVAKEALRWHTVLPLSIPHRTTEDVVYDGYFIPAGTIIIPDTWRV